MLAEAGGDFSVWAAWKPPAERQKLWPELVALLQGLAAGSEALPAQVNRVRKFYGPILETNYDHVQPRLRDLEQLEQIAGRWRSRRRMLMEMALDPPNSTQDFAGPPLLDDDYLVLSTIHSAKGLEWDAVYVIHAADGNIPSDMSTKDTAGVEEERRLFYVALTRAKNWLYVLCPLRYYHSYRPGVSDRYGMAQRTRFLPEPVLKYFRPADHHGDERAGRRRGRVVGSRADEQGDPGEDEGVVGVRDRPRNKQISKREVTENNDRKIRRNGNTNKR